jgi:hypothetical protein
MTREQWERIKKLDERTPRMFFLSAELVQFKDPVSSVTHTVVAKGRTYNMGRRAAKRATWEAKQARRKAHRAA